MKCFSRYKLQLYETYPQGHAFCIWEVENGPNYKWDYNDGCEAGFLPGCVDEFQWETARWWEVDPYYDKWEEECNPLHEAKSWNSTMSASLVTMGTKISSLLIPMTKMRVSRHVLLTLMTWLQALTGCPGLRTSTKTPLAAVEKRI